VKVLCIAVWLLPLALAAAPAASEEPAAPAAPARHTIGSIPVTLDVPEGFQASDDFEGIGRAEDMTSVMATALGVPVTIAAEAFSASELAKRGIELIGSSPARIRDGREGTRFDATQRIGGMSFRKWFLLVGDDTRSLLLTATTPSESEAQYADTLVRVLESASSAAGPAQPKALSFQVKEVAPLRIVRSGDDSLVLSEPAAPSGHVVPLVSVGASRGQVQLADLAGFARARLEETVSIDQIELESQAPRRLAALDAHAIAAKARDTESGRAVEVRQILASDGARYYLVQGIFDAEDAARLDPVFEALAESFALRAAPAVTSPTSH
jgi:hypothetical protein